MATSRAAWTTLWRRKTRRLVFVSVVTALGLAVVLAVVASTYVSDGDRGDEAADTRAHVRPDAFASGAGHRFEVRVTGSGGEVAVELPRGARLVNVGDPGSDSLFWSDRGLVVSLRNEPVVTATILVEAHPQRTADWTVEAADTGRGRVDIFASPPEGKRQLLASEALDGGEVVLHVDGRRLRAAVVQVGRAPLSGQVLAHYVPWFPKGDYNAYRNAPSPPMSTRNVDDVERTIRRAKATGLDGFAVSYWGLPHPDFDVYMEAAARVDQWRTVVILETKIANVEASSHAPPDPDVVLRWLRDFFDRYGDEPGLLRVAGAPVVFSYRSDLLDPSDWRAIRDQLSQSGHEIFLVGGEARSEHLTQLDGTFTYNTFVFDDLAEAFAVRSERTRTHHLVNPGTTRKVWVGTAAPGMNTANPNLAHRYIDRAGGRTFGEQWRTAVDQGADAMFVVSWNEFIEDTAVAPSVAWGDRYADLLADLISGRR